VHLAVVLVRCRVFVGNNLFFDHLVFFLLSQSEFGVTKADEVVWLVDAHHAGPEVDVPRSKFILHFL
jgi:hypothetical protein